MSRNFVHLVIESCRVSWYLCDTYKNYCKFYLSINPTGVCFRAMKWLRSLHPMHLVWGALRSVCCSLSRPFGPINCHKCIYAVVLGYTFSSYLEWRFVSSFKKSVIFAFIPSALFTQVLRNLKQYVIRGFGSDISAVNLWNAWADACDDILFKFLNTCVVSKTASPFKMCVVKRLSWFAKANNNKNLWFFRSALMDLLSKLVVSILADT